MTSYKSNDRAHRNCLNLASKMTRDDYESNYFFSLHFSLLIYTISFILLVFNEFFSNKYMQKKCYSSGICAFLPSYIDCTRSRLGDVLNCLKKMIKISIDTQSIFVLLYAFILYFIGFFLIHLRRRLTLMMLILW